MPAPTECTFRRLSVQYDGTNAADIVAMYNLPTATWDPEAAQFTWSVQSQSGGTLTLVATAPGNQVMHFGVPAHVGDHFVWSYEAVGNGWGGVYSDEVYRQMFVDLPAA